MRYMLLINSEESRYPDMSEAEMGELMEASILVIVYHILTRREPYRKLGVTYIPECVINSYGSPCRALQ